MLEMVFDCRSCGLEFNSGMELENHGDLGHNFECQQCDDTFPMKNQLGEHMTNCHQSQPTNKYLKKEMTQCPHCEKVFKGNKTLKKHIVRKHIDNVSPKGGQKTQQNDAIANESNQCTKCEKVFRDKETLKQHDKKLHKDKESSDDEFDQEMSNAGKQKVFTSDNDKKMYDYDEDDLYDKDSSSDEDTVLQKEALVENENRGNKSFEESNERRPRTLEDEANKLNKLKLQLKIFKAKSTLETALEQGKGSKKDETLKPLIALGAKRPIKSALAHGTLSTKNNLLIENESPIIGKQKLSSLVQSATQRKSNSAEFFKEALTESKPVACVKPQQCPGEQTGELEMLPSSSSSSSSSSSYSSEQFCGKETNKQTLALSAASIQVPESEEKTFKLGKKETEVKEESEERNGVLAKISVEEEAKVARKEENSLNKMDKSLPTMGGNFDLSEAKSRSFPCDNCGKSFETEESLVKHVRKSPCEANSSFDCTHCGKAIFWLASLYRHLKQLEKCDSNETGKSGFVCKYCGEKFQDGESLYHHMKRLTSAAKDLKTKRFAWRFASPSKDLKERKTKKKCDRCGYVFRNINHLNGHMKRCAGDSIIKCKKCGHPYLHRDSLMRHMKKSPSCGQVFEPKARKKCPKRTLAKQTNLETREKAAWEHHGVGKNQTEMLFITTSSRISR